MDRVNFPASIKVGDKVYTIYYVDSLDEDLANVDFENLVIKLMYPHPDFYNTFVHEVIHIIEDFFNIDYLADDEARTEAYTSGLRMICQNNNWFVDFLIR